MITSILLIALLSSVRARFIGEGNVVEIVAFGEGRCRDTTYWFKHHLLPMWKIFGSSGRINLTYHPYGLKTMCIDTENGDISCKCHHGDRECLLNQLQSCVIDALPRTEDHLPYVGCIQGKENATVAGNECFNQPGLSRKQMMECATGRKGKKLFWGHEAAKLEYAPDNYWVPWVIINGKRIKEGESDLWQLLCDRFLHPRPIECPRRSFY
ncbi:unnamed protein product [Caenorhabditis bovis]|uniref:GILT-like protein n=1 Tax=Caenorhabditis bovis TaxID=2654633 RepID=A0A8S1EQF8_9PELO|nr:unnamed protein product [Caenorhabditis bovis]